MRSSLENPIFGISAPSAAGKTWLAKQLIKGGIVSGWPSYTTRTPRAAERSTMYDHIFVDDGTFGDLKRKGQFILLLSVYGANYGMTKPIEDADRPTMVLIKPQVIGDFKRVFEHRAVVIGVHSANGAEMAEKLMQSRGQDASDIERRLAAYRQEIAMNEALIPSTNYFVSDGHPREIVSHLTRAILRYTNDPVLE